MDGELLMGGKHFRRQYRALRFWRAFSLVAAAVGMSLVWATIPAFATPPTNDSFYENSTRASQAEEDGCIQGILDSLSKHNSMVILDFGGQLADKSGTESTIQEYDFTNAQIKAIAEAFATSYYVCTEEDTITTLTLGIGTNNSKAAVTKAGGETWASIVNAVASEVLEDPGEAKQVAIWGADDLEVGYSGGGTALAWASGYNESTESSYIDYGGAEGCPSSTHVDESCTGGYSGWDQAVEYELSWGLYDALAAPEIYYNPPPGGPINAEQWSQIMRYGDENATSEYGCQAFEGPLTEGGYEGSNTAGEAWDQLKDRVEAQVEAMGRCEFIPEFLVYSLSI
jgi:hypothetical protein